jgi:quercetin dioxygenase-like cupin family protein
LEHPQGSELIQLLIATVPKMGSKRPKQRRMTMATNTTAYPAPPPDDLKRNLTIAQINKDQRLRHIGLVGDTYTITVTGDDTAGRFSVIDMHIPPGGGPPPHRHDFEETFILLEGEIEATFRGKKSIVRAGDTVKHPGQRPTSVPQRFVPIDLAALHLFPCRVGEFLYRGWNASRDPHDASS